MEIKNISSKGLERVFSIDINENEIDEKLKSKLVELSSTIRLPGFRPGKVPISLVKSRFGNDVSKEVINELLDDASKKLINDEKLKPVTQPKIDMDKYEDGKALKAKISLEIMPEIKHTDLTKIKLDKFVADVSDKEINDSLKKIADQNKQTIKIEVDRKSKKNDTLVIDFIGTLNGEKFEGGEAKSHHLLLGSNSFIPGFEEGLVGLKVNQEKTLKLKFPKDYGVEKLSGKEVEFEVKIIEIREHQNVNIDDKFAKSLGLEDLKGLKDAVSKQLSDQHSEISKSKIKLKLLDSLDEKHTFELPKSMVDEEYKNVCKSLKKDNIHDHEGVNSSLDKKMTKNEKDDALKIAQRRVKLGLLIGEIGRLNNLEVSEEEINQAIQNETRKYPGQEKQVLDYFKKNKGAAQQLASPIFEEKVISFILEIAEVKENKIDVDTLYKNDDNKNTKKSSNKTKSLKTIKKTTSKVKK